MCLPKLSQYRSNGARLNPKISLFSPLAFFDFFFVFPPSDAQYNGEKNRIMWREKNVLTGKG
jgi:hypothetical protein